MKLFTKNTFRNLALSALSAAALSACGGAGSCTSCNTTPAGDVTLTLTAPNQYPAGLSTPITAYLTMNNTSNVNATNLSYAVPAETNYTGVAITVVNGASNPCLSIPAQQSCTFPVTISAYAHTGSFTVTATPNSSASQSTVKKIWSSLKSELGLQAGTLSLTANIGLTDVPANTNSGANGITFLYSSTIAASESGDTLLSVVGVVNSAEAGAFNTINLTDQSGNPLSFTVLSGNSGQGASNLGLNSLVTFLLKIPSTALNSTFNFYAQTTENGAIVDQGTTAWPVSVGSATAGVLVIQPTNFSLTAPNNESQIVTFTNIGNGSVNSLSIPTPASPLYMISNTCGSSLAAGASCTYVLGSHAEAGFSGDAEFTASYNNGSSSNVPVAAQVHYAGVDPVAGISVSSGDNPSLNFVANTEFTSKSSQLTLSNTGNVSESNFVFTVPQYFALTAGTTGTPCTLSGNTVTTVLTKDSSCTLSLTYTNAKITASSPASLLVNYKFHGVAAPQSSIPLTYQTVQASAILQVSSPVLPYTFPNIRANQVMSESQVYVYTNIGTGTATNVTVNPVLQGGGTVFHVIPSQPSAANDCGSSKTSLAPSATCQVTVRFGPTGAAAGSYTQYLPVSYESIPAATPLTLTTDLQGTVLNALSANIIVSAVGLSPNALGGDGSSPESAFAFESSNSNLTVTLTYKNIGDDIASNLIIDSTLLPPSYNLISNGCNNQALAINATCTVVIQRSLITFGDANVSLEKSLPASWTDENGNAGPMPVQWDNNGTLEPIINITVYQSPSVTAMMSYESSGLNPITNVNAESDFYVVYQLIGGYNVSAMTYGVNITNAQGGTPAMSVYAPISCTLSQNQKLCYIKLNAGGSVQNQSIGYTAQGSAIVSTPTTSGSFNVIGKLAYVLSQDKIYAFDYNSTTGVLTANSSISTNGSDAVGIVSSIDGKYLYVVDKTQSMIKSFAVNNAGALTFIESVATGNGPSSGSLRFDPAGKYLYSSAAGAQNVTVFAYDPTNGHLTQQSTVSSGAHPSFMSFTPNGKFVYVSNDLGVTPPAVADSARVNMYQVQNNGDLVALAPESSIQSLGNNPYSSVVDPSGKYLYVANVGPISWGFQYAATTVSIYDINQSSGALSYNTTQNLAQVESSPVAILSDPTGNYLYVANAVSGSISQLSINVQNGSLSPLTPQTVTAGATPVSLTYSPDHRFVYSVSQYGNFIQMYNYNSGSGLLSASGSPIATGSGNQSAFLIFSN